MKDIDFEINFYENLIKRNPGFAQALIALGDLYTKQGRYEEGLKIDQKLSLLRPDDPIIQYNLACSYSLLNQLDKSLATIKKAIECGYDNLVYLEKDEDLKNLRKDGQFQSFFASIKDNKSRK